MQPNVTLTPIDGDPFVGASVLTPIDHDPFAVPTTHPMSHTQSESGMPYGNREMAMDNTQPFTPRLLAAMGAVGGDKIKGLATNVWDAVTLPSDVLTGKIDPESNEAVRRSVDLAGLVTLPAAGSAAEPDTLFMGGYSGYSRSNNALAAEAEGKLPLTRAIPELAKKTGMSRAEARELLTKQGPSEWHHTSKEYNRTNYFDVNQAVRWFEDAPKRAAFEPFRADMIAAHTGFSGPQAHARLVPLYEKAAKATGLTVEEIENLYYNLHSSGQD